MPLFHSNALMAGWGPALAAGRRWRCPPAGGSRRRASSPTSGASASPTSTTWASRSPTSWPPPSGPTTPTTRWCGRSATRAARGTWSGSPTRFGCAVTDAYGSTEGGAIVARTPDTPPGALGRAPEGTVVLDPATGEECPPARFDDRGRLLNADRGHRRAGEPGGGAGFEGYWRNDEAEQARLREGWYWTGRPRLPRRGRVLLLRRPGPRLAAGGRGELRRRPRSSGSSSATPTWSWPPSTPCPTRWSATR